METEFNQKSDIFIKKLYSKPKFIIRYGLILVFIPLFLFVLLAKNIISKQEILNKNNILKISYTTADETTLCTIIINENYNIAKELFNNKDIYSFIYSDSKANNKGILLLNPNKNKFIFELLNTPDDVSKIGKPTIENNNDLFENILNIFNISNILN